MAIQPPSQQIPVTMRKLPLACAYIVGVYDVDVSFIEALEEDKDTVRLLRQLNANIKRHHPRWNGSEAYYRGLDLSEAFQDLVSDHVYDRAYSEEDRMELLHKMKRRVRQHHSLVLTAHAIGTRYHDAQE